MTLMQHFDVIIIGSGISGLNFALRAAEKFPRVLVVTKKRIAETGTNFAQGGIAAVLSKLDDYKKHIEDTVIAGAHHNDRRAVTYMVKHGPEAIQRLIDLGVPFATQHGKLLLTREGGHSERRIAFVSDYTGQAIEEVLIHKVKHHPRITLWEHALATELLVKNKICYGVQVLRENTFENVTSDMTILATGGIGQLYAHTTNPSISTGDGIAMAARVGCQFRDLEFVQFHPTAFRRKNGEYFLISEAVRGEGAYIRNGKGKRFMVGRHKLAELAPRDIVAREIFKEEQQGNVYLDLRHKSSAFLKTRFPQIYQTLKAEGLDMAEDLIPITPAAHYLCGGIRVNLRGETGITNLYAFGEVSGTGVHGANRLASNSLLEALVFSDRILKSRVHLRSRFPKFSTPKFQSLTKHERQFVSATRKELRQTMWSYVGIMRSRDALEGALHSIAIWQKQLEKTWKNHYDMIELKNMLQTAFSITKAALHRKKSLGCHFRSIARFAISIS